MASTLHPTRAPARTPRRAGRPTAPPRRLTRRSTGRRWRPAGAAVLLAGAAGVVTGQLMPLGPTSAGTALAVMATGAVLGAAGGRAVRSAWSVVPLAAVHLAALEIARSDLLLPTVHDLRPGSTWWLLVQLLGRGLHGVLLLLPMVLAARLTSRAGRGDAPARHPRASTATTGLVGVLVAVLAVLVALPATTPPVRDADGQVVPGSIATLDTVVLGGDPHTVMIRAADPDAPVLLYLSGGPGQSDLALARVLSEPWVDDVVFATFDQRGNGTSYPALLPTRDATLARAVADVAELAEYLRARFDEDKVILLGESWGTLLGVLTVQQRPDLFHAYLGSGQMVDVAETDRRIFRDLVAHARRTGDEQLAALTRRIGEPPYADEPWANAEVMAAYGYLYDPYTPPAGYRARGAASGLDGFGLRGVEYTLTDKVDVLRGLVDTFSVLYPQIQDLDLRDDVPQLGVPVFVLDGAAELDGRRDLALEWFDTLDAPSKRLVSFPDAAHAVAFEQADAVDLLLEREVLPLVGQG
ncbi:alpha/beta fold hydrolase [uncultured Cellulomonas sp.]|uniref:alpha/beta fold hydrolase n=1 Tax=uncultured Cellulomonas sp. TaxID=189682 RepID=UPI00260663B3|nr:alpha/beta hydrolase [uncultured Cellulomonas sp.]